jgi:hypothetical protein
MNARHNPITPDAEKFDIVLGAFVDGCMVDSLAFDGEEKVSAMKKLLVETHGPKTVVFRKLDHKPTR